MNNRLQNQNNPYRIKMKMVISILLVFALVSSSCGFEVGLEEPLQSAVDRAVDVIENGIRDIEQNSEIWQSVLQRVANELPEEISETIRVDAQSLATRAIATTGSEFRCDFDFLGHRAIQSLQRLKAKLLGTDPTILPPAFCQVDPPSIDLKVSPEKWSTVILYGYDLDHKDKTNEALKILLLDDQGGSTPLAESRIGRTTHYQITLNLGNMARELYDSQVNKMVVSWEGTSDGYPQIVVVPWEAHRPPYATVSIDSTDFTPPHTAGNKDFWTRDESPTELAVCGQMQIENGVLYNRVYMFAQQIHPEDNTAVEGWDVWRIAYQAPPGYRIVSVTPNTSFSCVRTKVSVPETSFDLPAGEIVSHFQVWIDRSGDEAGTWSRVSVEWRALQVVIEQTRPEWLR